MIETRHVMPVNDLIDHDDNADCACLPECQIVEREDGSMGFLYVHSAWDGRE